MPKGSPRPVGFSLVVCVHGMQGPQSVAGSRYADVEGMPPQPAVGLHQHLVRSAPVGGTPGFDQVVEKPSRMIARLVVMAPVRLLP